MKVYSSIFCKKFCNLCEPEDGPTMPPVSCEDTYPVGCPDHEPFCHNEYPAVKENMEKICPKTCGLCEPEDEPTTPIVEGKVLILEKIPIKEPLIRNFPPRTPLLSRRDGRPCI